MNKFPTKIPQKVPMLKHWLAENGITQEFLHQETKLCVRTMSKLVNKGIGNKSTILLTSLILKISEKELVDLLITADNKHLYIADYDKLK
jgi:hypothetical protein